MFKWNSEFNLVVDSELFESYICGIEKGMNVDDLHFTVLAMIGALAIHNPYAPCIYTTLDNILITMAQDVEFKATAKIRNGIMNGFNTLNKYGAIVMSEPFTGDKKQIICITVSNVAHVQEDCYFQIGRKELSTIMKESSTPHHLITILCNYASRFNVIAYTSFQKGEWHKEYYDSGASTFKKLSCWASQDTITSSWINVCGEECLRKDKWEVRQPQYSRYCSQLVELKILDRIVIAHDNGRTSYYFRPTHRDCVLWSLDLLSRQQDWHKEK